MIILRTSQVALLTMFLMKWTSIPVQRDFLLPVPSVTGEDSRSSSLSFCLLTVSIINPPHSPSLPPLSWFCVAANCNPQCKNGGMCLRPQLCVCKPGSNGKSCEQKTVPTRPFPAPPVHAPTNGHTTGNTDGHGTGSNNGHNVVPQRPIPQQVHPSGYRGDSAAPPANNMAQMKLTVKPAPQLVRPHYIQQHIQQQ